MSKEVTDREIQLKLLKISEQNSTKFDSIKKNLKFIVWYLVISIIITAFILAKLFGETGYFRSY